MILGSGISVSRKRRTVGAFLLSLLAACASACSPGNASQGAIGSPTAPSPAGGSTQSLLQSSPATPAATSNFVINYEADDGTKVTVTFSLRPAVKADDASVAALFPSGTPCQADPDRDAVITGTMTVENDTPGFDTQVSLLISTTQITGDASDFGAAYSNGPQCDNLDGSYGAKPVIDLSGQQWGPTQIEFVIHDAYTPGAPDGDNSVIAMNDPIMGAFEGDPSGGNEFSIVSVSGYVARPTGTTVELRLDELPNF